MKNIITIIVGFIIIALAGKFYIDYQIVNFVNNKPEIIIKSLNQWQSEQNSKAIKQKIDRFLSESKNKDYPGTGNQNSTIVMYEFFDYQCGVCKKFKSTVNANIANMKLYYVEFPILGKTSVLASRVALASQNQSKYKQIHDSLMAHRGILDEKIIFDIARKNGLDMKKLKSDMNSLSISKKIDKNIKQGFSLGTKGTPFNIITNGSAVQVIPGYIDKNQLNSIIKLMDK